MALQQTIDQMKQYLSCINNDIEKAVKGNKAASQRVRTNSIRLEKVGKLYRRESIKWEKSGGAKEVKTKVTDKPASATKAKAKTKAKAVAPKAKVAPKVQAAAKKKAPVKKRATRTKTAKKTTSRKKTSRRR